MKLTTRQAGILIGGIVVLLGGFFILNSSLRSKTDIPAVKLTIWGTDPSGYIDTLIAKYKTFRPNATVTYQYVDPDVYQDRLVNALASGNGPDVFMIDAHAIPKEQGKLIGASADVFTITQLRELFPTVVEQDFVTSSTIYALPLYIDTLALIYNKDLFDSAGIATPPSTWTAFQDDVAKLRTLADSGQIIRSGAALGGSLRSIPRAADIVYALMLQKGTQMVTSDSGSASFASDSGLEAFNFYLRFADPVSSYYTWNDGFPSAPASMASGKTAMMIGYKSDYDAVKAQSPFLNLGVAPLPQLSGADQSVVYADYDGLAVSKQSAVAAWGWDFTVFATTNEDAQTAYLNASGRAPALRVLIGDKLKDEKLGIFAKQALTARSWYQVDSKKIIAAFDLAIRNVLSGGLDATRALRQAKETVDQLMRSR